MTPAILVAAAGRSTRMRGRDKLLEEVEGRPLLTRQLERLAPLGLPVYVALPGPAHPRADCLQQETALFPLGAREGLSGTLRDALAAMGDRYSHILLVLPDLIDLTTADYSRVLEAPQKTPEALIWRGATEDGQPGHPVLFHRDTFAAFATLSGDRGAQDIVSEFPQELVPLAGARARLDLDTPEDWLRWRQTHSD